MKRNIKVRFHLGSGENFMKWRIENIDTKDVVFHEPQTMNAVMNNCKLYNQKASAIKIHNGANKTVCAWIMCESLEFKEQSNTFKEQIHYNPRVKPHWVDSQGNNVDKKEYKSMSINNKTISVI
jgi:hypothetical protein